MALQIDVPALWLRFQGSGAEDRSVSAVRKDFDCCRGRHGWPGFGVSCSSGFHLERIRFTRYGSKRKVVCSAATVKAALGPGPGPASSLSDHILDRVSCFLISRSRELIARILASNVAALDWLPSTFLEEVHRSEAFVLALVREGLVFGILALMYSRVDHLCKRLYRIVSASRSVSLVTDGAEYKTSVFHAAAAPLRLLIAIWASVRMLRILSLNAQLHHYVASDAFVKPRAIGLVVSTTWFFIRWKQHYIDSLISQHKTDKPRVLAFDRLVSLSLYFLAATSIADIGGFQLRSLLAVGGVSGLAVGLAAKELFSNFFGGVLIFLTRPFVIGETIKAGAVSGRVQDIGYLQTKVLGFDGVPLLVPNQAFINQVITNFSRANSKLLEASFYLHNQDIFLVNKITKDVKAYLKTHPQVTETGKSIPMCYLNKMGHWGPEVCIVCNVKFGEVTYFEVRQEIMVQVAKIIVDVLGEGAPYFQNSVTNLIWELRMHLLYAGLSDQSSSR